jgi:hypothetical protein
MPSTRRIVQRGRPIEYYEIAARQLALGTQHHDPGAVATAGYVITPGRGPTALWPDRTLIGPGATARVPIPREALSATAPRGRNLPWLTFLGEGWRAAVDNGGRPATVLAPRAHGRRTRGARLPCPAGPRTLEEAARFASCLASRGRHRILGCRARHGPG